MKRVATARRSRGAAGLSVAVLGLVAALGTACRDSVPPDAVARIGETTLLYNSDFQDYLRENGADSGALPDPVLAVLFRRFVDEALLAQWAVDSQWVAPGDSTRKILEVLLDRFPPAEASAEEVTAYHAGHLKEFTRGARVRIRQILCADRATAERARAGLLAGERLEAVVRRLRTPGGEGAVRAGDVAEFEREDLPPDFAERLFRMQPGQISEVLEAAQGFHVVELLALEPPVTETVEQAAPEIRSELDRRAADETLRKLVADARAHYDVVVYERNLPFALPAPDTAAADPSR
jgi:parvulin-like peptidyl-prolyl isomerase